MTVIDEAIAPLEVGSPAPDVELNGTDGDPVRLSEFWKDQPVVLVFLRHLGCVFCREQVALLRRDYGKFQALGAQVICIAQGDDKTGKAFSIFFDLPFPVLMCGEDLSAYQAYGLATGTVQQLFGFRSWSRGVIALMRGHLQGKIVGDGFQMGGAFVVDKNATVRFVHRNEDAPHHPNNRALLQTVQDLADESANLSRS